MSTAEHTGAGTTAHAAWHDLAQQLRVDSIRCTTAAGSGHPTSSMSGADLMAVLLSEYLRYDFNQPTLATNDHLIFSKGHASPLLYSMYKAAGAVTDAELLTLRKKGSRLEGHPTPIIPWVDVATGSLGQGLPIAVGVALCGAKVEKLPYRVWVVLGDSEMAEGSVWEACELAGHYHLDNLIAIVDMNRLGQRGETMLGWNGDAYAARARAFGWRAIQVDGHNLEQIAAAYAEATRPQGMPTMIIARTEKGSGFAEVANKENWHGKPFPAEMAQRAIAALGGERHLTVAVHAPPPAPATDGHAGTHAVQLPVYAQGTAVATRTAYGDALKALGDAHADVVAMDGEVSNSTYAETFAKAHPDRFFEQYIAEQQLVSSAIGFGVRGYVAFASTFAAFFSRAYDFIRMAAISRANLRLVGSHAGVSIGEDGPSQMALEDLAMMRAVLDSTVLYPSDANQTAHLVQAMAERKGISFLRTTREKTAVLYGPEERFPIGGSKVLRQSAQDQVTVVGAGITVHEALAAYDELAADGVLIRVIDLYSVKPVDVATLRAAAQATGGRIVVAEDHWIEGGLGDAVLEAFTGNAQRPASGPLPRLTKLAVSEMPGSATPAEQLDIAGISAPHIVAAVRALLG